MEMFLKRGQHDASDLYDEYSYGCIFCKTGSELVISQEIMREYPDAIVTSVRQIKHRSIDGKKVTEEQRLLPGYVFFAVPQGREDINPFAWQRVMDVFRLLTDAEGHWALCGPDKVFATWVIKCGGLIGLSQVWAQGDRVQVLSGPLKEQEGRIVKIDRRGRNGQIEVNFDGRVWRFWLAFEYTDIRPLDHPHNKEQPRDR